MFDINDLRAAVTLASFIAFLGIVAWAWSRSRRQAFDEAARLPLADGTGADDEGDRA
jgi:cytochrome c oxidase cbb3-type subunit 4